MKKKIVLFCLMIVLTVLFCTPAFAEESGTCGAEGDNLTWTLDDSGVLTISGTGEMNSMIWSVPWEEHLENITSVIISYGAAYKNRSVFLSVRKGTLLKI